MVDVAQLVRVPDCDSGCCRFESGHPPEKSRDYSRDFFSKFFAGFLPFFFARIFFIDFYKGGCLPLGGTALPPTPPPKGGHVH